MRSLHIDWGQGRIDEVSGLILDDRLFFLPLPLAREPALTRLDLLTPNSNTRRRT